MSAVAGEMRSALGDTTPEDARRQGAETFTAGSLDAMAAYARAQELNAAGKPQEALAKFNEAVRHDPQFGRAYMNIASIHTNLKQPELAEENYKKALKYVDRMTEREKYRTLGTYYLGVTRDYAKAIENYQALVKLLPGRQHRHGQSRARLRLRPQPAEGGRDGPARHRDLSEERAAADQLRHVFDVLRRVRRRRWTQAQTALKDNPSYEWAALTLALSRLSQGQEAEARAAYAKLKGMSALGLSLALMGEADLELYYGRSTRHAPFWRTASPATSRRRTAQLTWR